jgi:phage tail-like protein
MAGAGSYPWVAFRFAVEIDQLVVGGFSEVSGLAFESEVERFREGGFNGNQRELAGPVKAAQRVVLKRGLCEAQELSDWFAEVTAGRVRRRDLSVLLLGPDQSELKRWKFSRAYPVKWSGPQLQAASSAVALETLEFVHEGLAP